MKLNQDEATCENHQPVLPVHRSMVCFYLKFAQLEMEYSS
jgi:hypothetical protein